MRGTSGTILPAWLTHPVRLLHIFRMAKFIGYVVIKFDCAKVSGKLDYVKVTDRMSKGLKATVSLDGQKIPNKAIFNHRRQELRLPVLIVTGSLSPAQG